MRAGLTSIKMREASTPDLKLLQCAATRQASAEAFIGWSSPDKLERVPNAHREHVAALAVGGTEEDGCLAQQRRSIACRQDAKAPVDAPSRQAHTTAGLIIVALRFMPVSRGTRAGRFSALAARQHDAGIST